MATRKRPSSRKSVKGTTLALPLVLAIRILIVMLFFFLTRVLFWLFNLHYFSDLAGGALLRLFFRGILFDLSAVLAINLPLIILFFIPFRFRYKPVYLRTANILFYTVNIGAVMVNFIDTVYFRFTLKRLTSDIFKYLGVGGDFNEVDH